MLFLFEKREFYQLVRYACGWFVMVNGVHTTLVIKMPKMVKFFVEAQSVPENGLIEQLTSNCSDQSLNKRVRDGRVWNAFDFFYV